MKYLIEIHHGIGDIVQMTGILDGIMSYDKKAEISLILNRPTYASMFRFDSRVKNLYFINLKTMSKIKIFKTVYLMRKQQFDYFLISCISSSFSSKILSFLIGAKHSYGEQLGNVEKITGHRVLRNNRLLCAIYPTDKIWRPHLLGVDRVREELSFLHVLQKNKQIVGVCCDAARKSKNWSIIKYTELIEKLVNYGCEVYLFGGENKKQLYLNDNVVNLMGKLNLIETAAMMCDCDCIVGGDTGPMHIAAAVGIKTITIFGSTNPQYHAPFGENNKDITLNIECQYCYDRNEECLCNTYKCLEGINVDNVFEKILEAL